MSVNQWVERFRILHRQARKGLLSESEQRSYEGACESFAQALVRAQGLSVPENQSARRVFRVAQGLQVDISFDSGPLRAMTLDVAVGSFSVMMHKPPPEKESPGFSLRLPGTQDPILGRAQMTSELKKMGTHRVVFSMLGLSEKDEARLEGTLFDLALERIK